MTKKTIVFLIVIAIIFTFIRLGMYWRYKNLPWMDRIYNHVYGYLSDNGITSGYLEIGQNGMFYLNLERSEIVDLSILKGMPIDSLRLSGTDVEDLSSISDFSEIFELRLSGTKISDLSPIANLPLRELKIDGTLVKNISSISNMPLRYLSMMGITVTNIDVLKEMNIQDIEFSPELLSKHQLDILRRIKFNTINMQWDNDSFWNDWDRKEGQYRRVKKHIRGRKE